MGMIGVYLYHTKAVGGNGTTTTFVSPPIQRGQNVEITGASVSDYTTVNKLLTLGIRDAGGSDHYIITEQGAALRTLYLTGRYILLEGESIIGIVASTTTSDALYFTVHGKRYSGKIE